MNSIIKDALNFYDKNYNENKRIFENYYYYAVNRNLNDMEKNFISFYDNKKKHIIDYDVELIGIYFSENIWEWGWANVNSRKNMTFKIREVLNYAINLDPEENKYLKKELITSSFRVTNSIQLDIHLAISSYLTKNKLIYPLVVNREITYPSDKDFLIPIEKKLSDNFEIHFLFLYKK